MLRLLGIATLVLMVVCLAIGASIALADSGTTPTAAPEGRIIGAVDPDRRMTDDSLAAIEDVYEFDIAVGQRAEPHTEFAESSGLLDV